MFLAALAVAAAFWGPGPPTSVHVHSLPGRALGQTACFEDGHCEVQIDSRRWTWGQLCSVILHEDGHAHDYIDPVGIWRTRADGTRWLDRAHSPDRRDVMFPELVRTADACRGKRPARYPRGAVIRL